jgi:hypothetical protein
MSRFVENIAFLSRRWARGGLEVAVGGAGEGGDESSKAGGRAMEVGGNLIQTADAGSREEALPQVVVGIEKNGAVLEDDTLLPKLGAADDFVVLPGEVGVGVAGEATGVALVDGCSP